MQRLFLFGKHSSVGVPMSRRHWKKVQPRDLRDAMELCTEYARDKHHRSVEQIADLMGEVNKWTLYKWIESGSLPVRKVKPFEHACGIDFVSRWLAMGDNKMVIAIPTGRKVEANDVLALQESTNEAIGALLKFYKAEADEAQTLASLQTALERLAWHKGNVEKYRQPELPFE